MAGASCSLVTVGTCTVGMFGPSLITRFTAELRATDAPAAGSVDNTSPLALVLVLKLVEPRVRWSFCSVCVAVAEVSPTTLGTLTLPPRELKRK